MLPVDVWLTVADYLGHHSLAQTNTRLRNLLHGRTWHLRRRCSAVVLHGARDGTHGGPLNDGALPRCRIAPPPLPPTVVDPDRIRIVWIHLVNDCNVWCNARLSVHREDNCLWMRYVIGAMECAAREFHAGVISVVVESPCKAQLRSGDWGPWWRALDPCLNCCPLNLWHPLWPHRAAAALQANHTNNATNIVWQLLRTIRDRDCLRIPPIELLCALSPAAGAFVLGHITASAAARHDDAPVGNPNNRFAPTAPFWGISADWSWWVE